MRWDRLRCVAGVVACFAFVQVTLAQEDEEESSPYRPGLWAQYENLGGPAATRIDSDLSFVWDTAAPDPRLTNWPFRVAWRGFVLTQTDGSYQFSVFASGRVTVRLGGHTILNGTSAAPAWFTAQPVELDFGWHPLEVEYESDEGASPQIGLYWSGPGFALEPVPPWHLYHDANTLPPGAKLPTGRFERGQQLARALRCEACHRLVHDERPTLDAPSLKYMTQTIHPGWLVEWLADASSRESATRTDVEHWPRRMPHFGLSRSEATSIAAYLFDADEKLPGAAAPAMDEALVPRGRQLFLTIGCLACHGFESYGDANLFGGGDLSQIAAKRPSSFFGEWLADPARLNPRHRMPVFALSDAERDALAAFLTTLGTPAPAPSWNPSTAEHGGQLVARLRCAACHDGVDDEGNSVLSLPRPLGPGAQWNRGCLEAPELSHGRPGYQLTAEDRVALREYFEQRGAAVGREQEAGEQILAERNCLSCHARGNSQGMAARLPELVEAFPDLAPSMSALTPPSLNGVGDKLHDAALLSAIRRGEPPHRPWLQIRMPRFPLDDSETERLVQTLIRKDRIPPGHPQQRPPLDAQVSESTGARLVTQDGFGCTSCHAVGRVRAPNAPLQTIGPDLLQLERRIRREWFDRWVRNPARIVPRMEMPSVQTPVAGVLDENLDLQLAAVWETLNLPDFRPPDPHPVRVVRRSGVRAEGERAVVLTDVLEHDGAVLIKPLLIALPNRHNLLIDLHKATTAGWWSGDAARQRTRGKSWYWESAGQNLYPAASADGPEFELRVSAQPVAAVRNGQFFTAFDEILHETGGVRLQHRLRYADASAEYVVSITQRFQPHWDVHRGGVVREIAVNDLPKNSVLRMQLYDPQRGHVASREEHDVVFAGESPSQLKVIQPASAVIAEDGTIEVAASQGQVRIELLYEAAVQEASAETFAASETTHAAQPLKIVPGFAGIRLPLPNDMMPTGLAWTPDQELVLTSLKGQVWRLRDSDGDGLEDQRQVVSDELAAPYGIAAGPGFLDVINKYALLRLYDEDDDGFAERMVTLASGWGHTADYHDWAVGLLPDGRGGYWIALPCQQDQRSPEAAHLRGHVLRLSPAEMESAAVRPFSLHPFSAGHRFPMGLAMNRAGDLFVTDNQGNYNPFNELNHARSGAHFGFINALERAADSQPPRWDVPVVNIPHPWTRSVNGICLLETPDPLGSSSVFGPFEGHIVGCEYDTRRLIRLSLEKVGNTYQGAVYPFSVDQPSMEGDLIGPLVASVSPRGELYIGCIRDSGWGGANNIGGVVRLTPQLEELPAGIAEVRALSDGFRIHFTRPIDTHRASEVDNYVVSSYRRIATPDYGGLDVERRVERPLAARVAASGESVDLTFDQLRTGYVYEFHLRNLAVSPARGPAPFFPAEAYYTLNTIPSSPSSAEQ